MAAAIPAPSGSPNRGGTLRRVSYRRPSEPRPRSLVWATDVDVLPADHEVQRRDGYLVIRSRGNPTHYYGNLLLFDAPPAAGDRSRWETLFAAEFADQPLSVHRTFGWDVTDDEIGAAESEFVAHGYDLERNAALVARPDQLVDHPRANREVEIRALDPRADEPLWDAVVELQLAGRDPERYPPEAERGFTERRLAELRDLFAAGRGAWYVALLQGKVVGSCGIVVTDGRGRYQTVDTAERFRRQGICSRLLVEAARDAAPRFGAEQLVITADPDYHALGLYASLGFAETERCAAVCRLPERDRA